MANYNEPKYDTDQINYGFLKKILNMSAEEENENAKSYSKNFNSPPSPPYYVGWTYSQNNKIYRCVKNRLIGSFNITDWVVIYDQKQQDAISKNFLFLSEIELKEQQDGKIETYYQEEDPSINWETSILKNDHEGDYWRTNQDGTYKSYIYVKYATNPITYEWELVDVPISIFNTVDGHKNIYTSKPGSYLKGDLWRVTEKDLKNFQNLNVSIGDYVEAINDSQEYKEEDWQKKEDEITLKSIETYYYTTEEINKIVDVINYNIDAQIKKSDKDIRAYVKEEYTERTTTEELTKKVNANGEAIEEVIGENTTEIPTLNLAQLSILADGINSEVLKKVGNDEIISKINQSAEKIKILAKQIMFEGLVTANDNFKILEDGSIEAVNGSFKGNIYLPEGGEIIGSKGLLTNLQFFGKSSRTSTGEDFSFLGFKQGYAVDGIIEMKDQIIFDIYIPENFTLLEARLILFHAPVKYGYYENSDIPTFVWGYSQNIKLYKSLLDDYYRIAYIESSYDNVDNITNLELNGYLGTNGYTAPIPSDSSHKIDKFISGNFKSEIAKGINRFVIQTANEFIGNYDNVPDEALKYLYQEIDAAKQTGCVQAYIDIIGYLNYKEE